jgi:PIN domain nuclease of toxin-antitoxin system
MQSRAVLDASALLAYLQGERGADRVGEALSSPGGAAMSAINWAEVLSKLAGIGEAPEGVASRLRGAGLLGTALKIVPADEELAVEIARLRPSTRPAGLSLGDRACLALGRLTNAVVLTSDRAWAPLSLGVKITIVR